MDDDTDPPKRRIEKLLGLDAEQIRRGTMTTFANMTVDMLVKQQYEGLEAWTRGAIFPLMSIGAPSRTSASRSSGSA